MTTDLNNMFQRSPKKVQHNIKLTAQNGDNLETQTIGLKMREVDDCLVSHNTKRCELS